MDNPNLPGVQDYIITTTAGTYAFTGLAPGSYVVKETQPLGYTSISDADTTSDDSGSPADPANISATDNRLPVHVGAGETDSGNDFVERALKPTDFTTWATWSGLSGQDAAALPGPTGVGGNPDGDRFNNLLEFALCFPPQSGINPRCPYEIRITPAGRIDFAITYANALTDLTFTLQVVGELGSPTAWTMAEGCTSSTTDNGNGTSTLVYQDLESLGAAYADGDGFVRVQIGLDTNADNEPDLFDYTEAAGWTDHEHPGDLRPGNPLVRDQCTTFSMPYLKCAVLSGTANGNTATSIDLTDSVGAFSVAGALDPGRRYFVEITGGALEGHRFEVNVACSTATSLALQAVSQVNTRSLTAGELTGSRLVVRELWTWNELFPPAAFQGGESSGDSDALLLHDGTAWRSCFLVDLGGGDKRWVLDGDWTLADQGAEIIAPCEGLFVHRRGPSLTIARSGLVRDNNFAKPLPGTGCVLVGSGYPMPQSYTSRFMSVDSGWRGDVDLAFSSQVLFWLGDTIPGKLCYSTDFLLDAGFSPLQFWASADDSALTIKNGLPLFKGTGAAFHCLPIALPNYVVPVQW